MISARGINEYLVDLTGSTTGKIEGSIVFNNLNGKSLFNVNNININNNIKDEKLPHIHALLQAIVSKMRQKV